ncbi:Leader peptidase / N-methyltransferase [Gammaproteobacteria bacterium]
MGSPNIFIPVNNLLVFPIWWIAATAGLLGLVVGSFLNVVIHRLPRMLERQWRLECAASLKTTLLESDITPASYNLALPASHCPRCGHVLLARENIPLLSFLLQRGRCRSCGEAIPWRYPVIEAITGLSAAFVVWHFGPTTQAFATLCFTGILIAASAIDLEHQILPDVLTLPLLWLGLALSLHGVFVDSSTAIIGAMAGYLSLWSVYWGFRLLTGKEGMGYGDFKLLAALGAWMGWRTLPLVLFFSSLVGAVVGILLIITRGRSRHQPIPFGPFLAVAGWIVLLWGDDLLNAYLRWSSRLLL